MISTSHKKLKPRFRFSSKMKEILSILLGFLPWIAFGAIAGPSLFRLNAAIIAGLALVLVMGYKQLAKGFILTGWARRSSSASTWSWWCYLETCG